MALTNYSDLVTSVGNWLNRSDLNALIPDFIRLFETRFNREVRHPKMETTAVSVINEGDTSVALPSDFLAARTVYVDDDPDNVLVAMSPANLRASYPYQNGGQMAAYAISGDTIELAPAANADGTLTLAYYATVPALTSTETTNWLMTLYPDLYLYGTLCAAQAYLQDDPRLAVWKGALDEAMDSLMREGNKRRVPAGPLTMRSAVFE